MGDIVVSRRAFIGGAVALGAFGFKASDAPKLKLGVLSDVHVCIRGLQANAKNARGGVALLVRAFEYFRDQGVDGVVIAGDIANYGLTDELQAVADAWFKVFPNDRLPDGRKVERIFIYGNHDWEGAYYNFKYIKSLWPDEKEVARHLLRNDYAGHWRRIFHEEYEPIFRKTVKGYDFIGAHWDGKNGFGWKGSAKVEEYFKKNGATLDPSKPFFFVQHPHPKDTCYGPWVWGHDDGQATRALSAFPNAIAISGHSHTSLVDERSIWQGAFTSIGAASLFDVGGIGEEHQPTGRENGGMDIDLQPDCWKYDGKKMMPKMRLDDSQQGAVYSIYDDRLVINRREFTDDFNEEIGDDWVIPLPMGKTRPFAFAERAKRIGAPRFVADGKLEIQRTRAKNRGGKASKGEGSVPAIEHECFKIVAPAAVADRHARLFDLEFIAESRSGEKLSKFIAPNGFYHSCRHKGAQASSHCVFAIDELPKGGEVRFTVTPLNCYGGRGKPLVSEWLKF